jgi:hypothetical protein
MGYIQKLDYFMKTVLRKLFFNQKNRWIPILLFTAGFGMQITGKWLPTLVICYKANEKPKIEFFDDACDCRKECGAHARADYHECAASWQAGCLDMPLMADPGCGPLPRLPVIRCAPCAPTREFFATHFPPFLFCRQADNACPPPRSARTDSDSALAWHPAGSASLLCRFRC